MKKRETLVRREALVRAVLASGRATEAEIVTRSGLSRSTVRRALARLPLERHQDRSGTVGRPEIVYSLAEGA